LDTNLDYRSRQFVEVQRDFITKTYFWMTLALLITGIVALFTVESPALLGLIVGDPMVFTGICIGEVLLVLLLSAIIRKMSVALATIMFLTYSILNGLTISVIFLVFTQESIASTFIVTALTFGVMSFYGYATKKDLTSLGSFLFMGLIGIIIASLVNAIFRLESIYWITTYIGIFIFIGLTAYDSQKIKEMSLVVNEGTDGYAKASIIGALELYLDFINLFLLLLRIFGRRRR